MSISRTKVNALVDDDGSGTVGTLYNKARVVDIYDDVDLLLANRVTPAFNAGDYTGSGSMTVTVQAGDVNALSYQVTNKLITIWFELVTITIGGTPSTEVRFAIPAGLTASMRVWNPIRVNDNGTFKTGVAFSNATTFVSCYVDLTTATNWAASTNNSGISGQIQIPVT